MTRNKSGVKGDALDDAFAVLLRYAEISGEKLNATHAATAANIAQRTAYTRIARAKSEIDSANSWSPARSSSGGAEAFKVLLRYAEATGGKLKVSAAAKAAGIAERTAYTKVAAAAKEIKGADNAASDRNVTNVKKRNATNAKNGKNDTAKQNTTSSNLTLKTRSGSKRKRSESSADSDATIEVEPPLKKEKVDESVDVAGLHIKDEPHQDEEKEKPMAIDPFSTVDEHKDHSLILFEQEVNTGEDVVEAEAARMLQPVNEAVPGADQADADFDNVKYEQVEIKTEEDVVVQPMSEAVSETTSEAEHVAVNTADVKKVEVVVETEDEVEDEHWKAMMELVTEDEQEY